MAVLRQQKILIVTVFLFGLSQSQSPDQGPNSEASFEFTSSFYNASIRENSLGSTMAAPEEKMGIWNPNKDYQIHYTIESGDSLNMFKVESRQVGDFCFLIVRVNNNDRSLNREFKDLYRLKIKARVYGQVLDEPTGKPTPARSTGKSNGSQFQRRASGDPVARKTESTSRSKSIVHKSAKGVVQIEDFLPPLNPLNDVYFGDELVMVDGENIALSSHRNNKKRSGIGIAQSVHQSDIVNSSSSGSHYVPNLIVVETDSTPRGSSTSSKSESSSISPMFGLDDANYQSIESDSPTEEKWPNILELKNDSNSYHKSSRYRRTPSKEKSKNGKNKQSKRNSRDDRRNRARSRTKANLERRRNRKEKRLQQQQQAAAEAKLVRALTVRSTTTTTTTTTPIPSTIRTTTVSTTETSKFLGKSSLTLISETHTILFIMVEDIEDNTPVFESSAYDVRVNEDAPVLSKVTKITASDADSGRNQEIYYR